MRDIAEREHFFRRQQHPELTESLESFGIALGSSLDDRVEFRPIAEIVETMRAAAAENSKIGNNVSVIWITSHDKAT